jgi:hypothetical protein
MNFNKEEIINGILNGDEKYSYQICSIFEYFTQDELKKIFPYINITAQVAIIPFIKNIDDVFVKNVINKDNYYYLGHYLIKFGYDKNKLEKLKDTIFT